MRFLWAILAIASLAGCLSGADNPETNQATIGAEVTPEPLDWQGHLGTMLAVCPTGLTCVGDGIALQANWEAGITIANASALDVVLEWVGDGTNGNRLAIGLATQCNGPCDFVDYVAGTSPLAFNVTGIDPATEYRLVVWHPSSMEAGHYYQYGVEKDFTVTGTLTLAS